MGSRSVARSVLLHALRADVAASTSCISGIATGTAHARLLLLTRSTSCGLAVLKPEALHQLRGFAAAAQVQTSGGQQQQAGSKEQVIDSLELTDEKISALTDQIPQRPVGVVEGTSYTLIILAAFSVLAFIMYTVLTSLIFEPTALKCFNHTLDLLKHDPRVNVRVGSADDIRAWGANSDSRMGRQNIPHQAYKDAQGVEHNRIQFHIRGPSGSGLVHADMYLDAAKQWQYTYLLVDVYSQGAQQPSRLHIVSMR